MGTALPARPSGVMEGLSGVQRHGVLGHLALTMGVEARSLLLDSQQAGLVS